MDWRGWLSRKLLRFVARLDPDQRCVYQAGEFKFERGWQQPVSKTDFERFFSPQEPPTTTLT